MTRLERRNRTDIVYKGHGGLFDALDDAVKQGWRITDEEYDYLLDLDLEAERHLLVDKRSTRTEIKEALLFVNKYLDIFKKTLLTGKTRSAFKKWLEDYSEENHGLDGWEEYDLYLDEVQLPDTLFYALVIEWFDTQGYYISVVNEFDNKFRWMIGNNNDIVEASDLYLNETRGEATRLAIIVANKLYNKS